MNSAAPLAVSDLIPSPRSRSGRGVIWTLIGTLVLNPVLPALGQVVAAGGGTTVGAAGTDFTASGNVIDAAARIEARNDLNLTAGQNILNLGGALIAGNTLNLNAGNDVVIAAVEDSSSRSTKDKRHA
jgi:hypothetical protein